MGVETQPTPSRRLSLLLVLPALEDRDAAEDLGRGSPTERLDLTAAPTSGCGSKLNHHGTAGLIHVSRKPGFPDWVDILTHVQLAPPQPQLPGIRLDSEGQTRIQPSCKPIFSL